MVGGGGGFALVAQRKRKQSGSQHLHATISSSSRDTLPLTKASGAMPLCFRFILDKGDKTIFCAGGTFALPRNRTPPPPQSVTPSRPPRCGTLLRLHRSSSPLGSRRRPRLRTAPPLERQEGFRSRLCGSARGTMAMARMRNRGAKKATEGWVSQGVSQGKWNTLPRQNTVFFLLKRSASCAERKVHGICVPRRWHPAVYHWQLVGNGYRCQVGY